MYICDDCGSVFLAPAFYDEIHMELEGYPVEQIACCPECGGGNWSDAEPCQYCEEYFAIADLTMRCFCKECMEQLLGRPDLLKEYARSDLDAFAEFASEYLNGKERT